MVIAGVVYFYFKNKKSAESEKTETTKTKTGLLALTGASGGVIGGAASLFSGILNKKQEA